MNSNPPKNSGSSLLTESKPKFDLPHTRLEMNCEIVAIAAIVLGISYLLAVWSTLPQKIPSHFNLAGEADSWSNKESILLPVGIEIFVYVIMSLLSRYSQLYSYPWAITEENAERQFLLARRFLTVLKTEIVLLFTFLGWQTIVVARGNAKGLGIWFSPIFLIVILGSAIIYFVRAYRAR